MHLVTLILVLTGISSACAGDDGQKQFEHLLELYDRVRRFFGEERKLNVFGHQCDWTRNAGFSGWRWLYDGKIRCNGLPKVYVKEGCDTMHCAFKQPYKKLLKDLLATGRVAKLTVQNANEEFEGMLNEQDREELRALAN